MPKPEDAAAWIVESLASQGVTRIFGSPGTTELSVLVAAERKGLEYHFAAHDTVAVGMADGFARGCGEIAVANLHASQGLLNAAGFIRVALRDETPLLILAGTPATTYDIHEPNHYLQGLEALLSKITKWGWSVTNPQALPDALRRALWQANAPPRGPTFLCVPQDLLEGAAPDEAPLPRLPRAPSTTPSPENLDGTATALASAASPLLYVGAGARRAPQAVAALAEALAAPIVAESLDRGPQIQGVYCPPSHPLFAGFFDSRRPALRTLVAESDLLLLIGSKVGYRKVLGPLGETTRVVEIQEDANAVGRQRAVERALAGDVPTILAELTRRLEAALSEDDRRPGVQRRRVELERRLERDRRRRGPDDRRSADNLWFTGEELMAAIGEALPGDAVFVDDSQCLGHALKRHFERRQGGSVFGSLSSHLGWGLPAALGIQLALPSAFVVCLVGDGGLLFGLQALIAAASSRLPVLVVVSNNRGYLSLQLEVDVKWGLGNQAKRWLSLDEPHLGIVALATALGVQAWRASRSEALGETLSRARRAIEQSRAPGLVEVPTSPVAPDWAEAWLVAGPAANAGG